MKSIDEKVYIEVEDELLWITVSKYALFMSYGKVGIDAMALYMHYQFTARIQKTNSVWANDKYCRQGLNWGRDRFEKARNLLLDLDLISKKRERLEDGTLGKSYVVVKTKKVELEPDDISLLPENPQVDKTTSGQTTTNALTKKGNASTKKGNACKDVYKNEYFAVDKEFYDLLQETYVGINIEQCFKEMRIWLKNNPKKANKKDWKKFITNWIQRGYKDHSDDGKVKPDDTDMAQVKYYAACGESKKIKEYAIKHNLDTRYLKEWDYAFKR